MGRNWVCNNWHGDFLQSEILSKIKHCLSFLDLVVSSNLARCLFFFYSCNPGWRDQGDKVVLWHVKSRICRQKLGCFLSQVPSLWQIAGSEGLQATRFRFLSGMYLQSSSHSDSPSSLGWGREWDSCRSCTDLCHYPGGSLLPPKLAGSQPGTTNQRRCHHHFKKFPLTDQMATLWWLYVTLMP